MKQQINTIYLPRALTRDISYAVLKRINLINTSEVTDLASSQTTTENSVPRILAIKDSRNTEVVMCVMSVSIPHLYTIRVSGSLPAHAAFLSERN